MNRPVAFVTGAKRGIGRAIAEAFAAAGYDLVLADLRRDEEAEEACAAVRAGVSFVLSAVMLPYSRRLYQAKKTLSIDAFTDSKC